MDVLRERALEGESLDALLPECFAIVRETGKRTMGMRHFDVQLIGGMALHEGQIAEMKTGEGKTLTATLAVVLNSLAVHPADPDDPGGRARAQGRARGHGQRLPGAPRRRMDEPDLRRAGRHASACCRTCSPTRRSSAPTRATSSTGPTRSSASTTCATTWPRTSAKRSSAGTPSRSSTRSTTS